MANPDQDPPPFDLVRQPDKGHDPSRALRDLRRLDLPPSLGDHEAAAEHYKPSDELLTAINMAIHVGAPLLLTGEPGTGKTQAADFIGLFFAIPVFKFQVKSMSTAEDLKQP